MKKKPLNQNDKSRIIIGDSRKMKLLDDDSIELIVTSPPYPMIEMWDEIFSSFDPRIGIALKDKSLQSEQKAFDLMHEQLNKTLGECKRVLKDGGLFCINIGDAVRSINGKFQLFSNHARILESFNNLGLTNLPYILWKKPTNKPNAFLGSGFLPTNAYVTVDCEYILIARKGKPRRFAAKDPLRYKSRFSKAERDKWFSQIWSDIPGASQSEKNSIRRTAAFPIELPTRLIRMFSIEGDIVLDPFMGTGTTLLAASKLNRRFIGYEIDRSVISKEAINLAERQRRVIIDRQ